MNVFYESRASHEGMSSKIDGPFKDFQEAKRSANGYYDDLALADKIPVFVLEIKHKIAFKREPMGR